MDCVAGLNTAQPRDVGQAASQGGDGAAGIRVVLETVGSAALCLRGIEKPQPPSSFLEVRLGISRVAVLVAISRFGV